MTDATYLEEAAALLRQRREANEKRDRDTTHLSETDPVRKEIRAEYRWITEGFTALAAIEAGVANVTLAPEAS